MGVMDDDFKISSNSRSKLNVFRYAQNDPEQLTDIPHTKTSNTRTNDGKENETGLGINGGSMVPLEDKGIPSTQTKDNNFRKECPKTPANRIPLADLICNAEDAIKRVPDKDITPEDHVYWQHGPRSSDPEAMSTSNTPAPRGKKRGHSSSPNGSPRNESTKKEPFDLQAFQKMLKTPQSDMATDLWNSYIGKNSELPTNGAQAPLFSHLMASSPRTPGSAKSGRDSSGLRRSISCAVDWPTSKAKRRRVDGGNQANNAFARSKSAFVAGRKSNSSKIGLLVEKIQESLSKPSHEELSGPSSSSPLPDRTGNMEEFATSSPVQEPADFDMTRTPSKEAVRANPINPTNNENMKPTNNDNDEFSSSEFGDDDLDQDFLDLADSTINQPRPVAPVVPKPPEISNKIAANQPPARMPSNNRVPQNNGPRKAQPQSANPIPAPVSHSHPVNVEKDEFDDDDDEFADGMEEILAQYNQKNGPAGNIPSATKAQPGPVVPAVAPTNTSSRTNRVDNAASLSGDEFDDDIDLDVFDDTLLQAAQAASNQNKHKPSQSIKRYAITDTAENMYVNNRGRRQIEKVLSVLDEKTQENRVISLRESWFDCPYTKGSFIHLIGGFDAAGQCVVDDSRNMVILHPDHLLSATVVADSFTCNRRAVLQDRVKATSDPSRPQVYGHILHEIFQEAMKANRWDLKWLNSTIEVVLGKYVESLYTIHVGMEEATEYLTSKMPALKAWADLFVRSRPTGESIVEDRNGSNAKLSINKLLEVEEHVWSPMYGLKGNIDATVQVSMSDKEGEKTLLVPLEVKTGRSSTNEGHRAQTALYTLLLSDRYDIEVTFGILYYLEATKSLRVQGIRSEIRQMLQQRNRLASYVRQRTELPPMLKRAHICNQCFSKTACFTYHKLVDDGDAETSGVGSSFLDVVGHVTPAHQTFFKKWDDLLTKEEKDIMRFRRELWTMVSSERETLGRCFSNVVIEPGSGYEDKDGPKINRFRYTFMKPKSAASFSFAESQITMGEPIVISDEKGHFALSNGYVVNVTPRRITVAVDRRLHNSRVQEPKFDAERNQVFKGIMEIGEDGRTNTNIASEDDGSEPTLYRLDKDEFSNGMATVRNNLVRMMDKDAFRARELRSMIIEGVAPKFNPAPSSAKVLSSSAHAQLNVDQHQAIEKVMSAQDYALVLGMPGTGKTTTIAHIIRALISQGKSVLLTSYTHTAVDNILLKIRDDNIPILRLGAPSKVHPEVQQFADLAGSSAAKTMEQLRASYEDSKVVATTCLGVNHPIFRERVFDYCIVDEASQITLPVCLGPILMAQTFILFGDHYQLPPLVQNKEAQEGGLDVSLFKLLSDAQPSSVVNLEHQYRMCEDIMELSNTLIYSGHLKCGTAGVASRSLSIPDIGALKQHHANPLALTASQSQKALCLGPTRSRCWIQDLINPSTKACLVNTDTLTYPHQALDSAKGSRIVNEIEAKLCSQLVESLISTGVPARDIGVITFYRSQLSLLKQNLRHHLPELEMHTADKFQGRDKEVVVLSCVRSNPDRNVGDLLRDWRRVNVAFTRARTKLLVVGSKGTLRDGNELLGKFVRLMEGRGWCYDLPPKAVEDHVFANHEEFKFTQQPQQQHGAPTDKKPTSPASSRNKTVHNAHTKGGRGILSPARNRANIGPSGSGVRKQPEKRGPKMMDGEKIVGSRPVLRDLANDVFG
ncbi:Tripartite DNA replication factor [Arachnomyces sp. PD_36]|nr:Tripartite DNA replication factor [Arachnomyces sp. PD_36]